MSGVPPGGPHAAHDDAWEVEAGIVRPYLFTQGRTEAAPATFAVEAVLTATRHGRAQAPHLPPERRRIVQLCAAPQSVAEVAVRLGVPLGVVRVLVGDLHGEGLLHLHATRPAGQRGGPAAGPGGAEAAAEELALLQRLVAHVRAIPA